MLNYSLFRASISPHAADISSSDSLRFAQSPPSLPPPRTPAARRPPPPLIILCHLYFVNLSLFLCFSSQLTLRWWHAVYFYPPFDLLLFPEHLAVYQKGSWSTRGAHLFWENLWWLCNARGPKMDSSFSVNLRRPAASFKVKGTWNKERGGLLIKYLT